MRNFVPVRAKGTKIYIISTHNGDGELNVMTN